MTDFNFYDAINLNSQYNPSGESCTQSGFMIYDRVAMATPVATITVPAALLSLRAAFLFVNI